MNRICLLLLLWLTACQTDTKEKELFSLIERYQQAKAIQFPDWASATGNHQYDHLLAIPTIEKLADDRQFCLKYLDSLQGHNTTLYSDSAALVARHTTEELKGMIQQIDFNTVLEDNPAFYDVRGAFQHVLLSDHKPLNARLMDLQKKLTFIPDYYKAAMQNLKKPSLESTQTAVEDHLITYSFFDQMMRDSLNIASISDEEKQQFESNLTHSLDAIKNYVAFCNSLLFEFNQLELKDSQE